MIQDAQQQVLEEMVRKDYVVYALRSAKEIKREYKELDESGDFKDVSSQELVFVWWFSIRCSPIIEVPEEKRVLMAIDKAFKTEGTREAKRIEYGSLAFPDNIKRAIKTMERFDPGGRVTKMANDRHILKQCDTAIRKDISQAAPAEITEYLKTVKLARELQSDILSDIERGGLGVAEKENTLAGLEGISGNWMKSRIA